MNVPTYFCLIPPEKVRSETRQQSVHRGLQTCSLTLSVIRRKGGRTNKNGMGYSFPTAVGFSESNSGSKKKKKVWINLMNKCHAVIFSEPCKYILKTWDIKKEINIIALWPGWDQFILLLLLIFFDIYFFNFKISSSMEVRIRNLDNPAADCFTVGFQKSLRMPRFYCCQWMCRVFSFQLCCLHIQSHLLLLKSRLAPRRDTQNVGYSEYSSWITVAFKKLLCEVKANMLHLQSPTNTC